MKVRRAWVALGITLLVASVALIRADVGRGNIAIPESDLIRAHGGVTFADWPVNGRWYANPTGVTQVPPGFHDELVSGGFQGPTALRFLPDGSLFVIEQRGTLVHYRLGDAGPDRIVVDARTDVMFNHQMGLLGLGIDPEFDVEPYVYLLYSRDATLGGQSPLYGTGTDEDPCPDSEECPASGRLARVRIDPTQMSAGPTEVLVDDWCAQALGHTVGNIAFDRSGALLAGGGDGAYGAAVDYGQYGEPPNACSDPPGPAGEALAPPTTEGGALRSQDLGLGDDPVGLSGTIIRVDRRTGVGLPDNPLASAADPNARRIVAYGLRNPYQFTQRPGTDDIWIAEVGFTLYEELDVLQATAGDVPPNFGWPCYEGPYRQPSWEELGTKACDGLYARESEVAFPVMSFAHDPVQRKRGCGAVGAAWSAIRFYDGQMFPQEYRGALFVADLPRTCLFVIQPDEQGIPDSHTLRQFARHFFAVDMVVGPDGALYYVDVFRGELRRIIYRE